MHNTKRGRGIYSAAFCFIAATAGLTGLTAMAANLSAKPAAARAGAAEGPRIGFVKVLEVAARSATVRQSIEPVEAELETWGREMERLLIQYQREKDAFNERRLALNQEQVRLEEARIVKLLDDVTAKQQAIEALATRLEREIMPAQLDRILDAVRIVSKTRGFDFVLQENHLLYGAEMHDLTALIVEELDEGAPAPILPTRPGEPGAKP